MVLLVGRCLFVFVSGPVRTGKPAGLVEACLVVRCDEVVLMRRCGTGRAFELAGGERTSLIPGRSHGGLPHHAMHAYTSSQPRLISIHHSL